MSPLDAAAAVVMLAVPLFWLVWRELAKLADPAYLREQGVVIVSESALQDRSAPIGEHLAPRELFLEPGLVYRVV